MNKDYKVKDISLAEFGRQEILLAQDESGDRIAECIDVMRELFECV